MNYTVNASRVKHEHSRNFSSRVMTGPCKYFDNIDDTEFDVVVKGTGLAECIIASAFTISGKKVLHIDSNDFYGGPFASLSLSSLGNIPQSLANDAEVIHCSRDPSAESFLLCNDKAFSVDVSVPKVLFCRDHSVDFLIMHKASKYMNFLSVKDLNVWISGGAHIRVPTTRNKIFQDKSLKLSEKRALMNLFKSAMDNTSTAIESSAHSAGDSGLGLKPLIVNEQSQSALEFLRTVVGIDRPELLSGIIHGVCLYPQSASTLLAVDLLDRIKTFISSLTQYEDGCPLLVPMYGNGDIPQAFARMAAVHGALYILGCDETQLRSEIGAESEWISTVSEKSLSVFHGVSCVKNASAEELVSVSVMHPVSFDDAPVFVIGLPSTDSSMGSPNVCPSGYTLLHFVQISNGSSAELDTFKSHMSSYLKETEGNLFEFVIHNRKADANIFSLEDAFEAARITFNRLLGLPADSALPHPPPDEPADLAE